MANWKKVIVSGSDAELSNLTVTDLATGTSAHQVVVSDNGVFKSVAQNTIPGASNALLSASIVASDSVGTYSTNVVSGSSANGNINFVQGSNITLTTSQSSAADGEDDIFIKIEGTNS